MWSTSPTRVGRWLRMPTLRKLSREHDLSHRIPLSTKLAGKPEESARVLCDLLITALEAPKLHATSLPQIGLVRL